MSHRTSNVLRSFVIASALIAGPAQATIYSSCPAPCVKPPKSALFMREESVLNNYSWAKALTGTLSRGTAHTVVRIDATFLAPTKGSMTALQIYPMINGQYADDLSLHGAFSPCSDSHPSCGMTATFWFDVDALDLAHPGMFVGQPLAISVSAGPLAGASDGTDYLLSFSAEVVKKK